MSKTPRPVQLSDLKEPEEILSLIAHDRLRWLIATIAMDGGKLPDDPRPDWAINATMEFWKSCQDLPRTKEAKSEIYRFGFMVGIVSRLEAPEALKAEPKLMSVVNPQILGALLHSELAKAPATEAAEFYAGYSDGLKRGQLSPRSACVIYLMFSVGWAELAELKNVTQLHAWFESNLGRNMTGSRDRMAKICQTIRMPLTDKGGRPKVGKPRKQPRS